MEKNAFALPVSYSISTPSSPDLKNVLIKNATELLTRTKETVKNPYANAIAIKEDI